MVEKLLLGWAALVLGVFVAAVVFAMTMDGYVKFGWPAVVVWLALVSAIPALIVGLWLKMR